MTFFLEYDSAQPQAANSKRSFLKERGSEAICHLPFFEGLVLSEYYPSRRLKNHLIVKRNKIRRGIKTVLANFFQPEPVSSCEDGIMKLWEQWQGVVNSNEEYVTDKSDSC